MRVFAQGGNSDTDPAVMAAISAAIQAFLEQEAADPRSRGPRGLGAWRTATWAAQPQATFGTNRSWRGIN
ncbi:MAG: hypothetical protein QGI88_13325 [SAR202 cluster bacterium]|nr:hypothetical protein [SAR202 cluster bacterium]